MTVWDKIYKDYQKGGAAWATLSEGIHPLFLEFIDQTTFRTKHALDIGCGTGKYLKFLRSLGFQTDGIDSSKTAVEMTKKLLGDDSAILCSDMFEFNPPRNRFDLIFSISTIHHGNKKQVQKTVNQIHAALTNDGKIFITIPDFESGKKWYTFKEHEELSPGTYAPLTGPEKGLPHSFYTKDEATQLFSEYKNLELDFDSPRGRWIVRAKK